MFRRHLGFYLLSRYFLTWVFWGEVPDLSSGVKVPYVSIVSDVVPAQVVSEVPSDRISDYPPFRF